jgi:hypothetical protein
MSKVLFEIIVTRRLKAGFCDVQCYATTSQSARCFRYDRCYSTDIQQFLTVKRFLSNQTVATENTTMRKGVFYSRRKHCIWGGRFQQLVSSNFIVYVVYVVYPCWGRVEYLHRDPVSRRRRRIGKSQIWDSKIRSRVPRGSDPKMTALARTNSNCKQQTRPLVRESAPYQQTRSCPTVIKIWP